MQIISDNNYRTSVRAVCVVGLISTVDNRTQSLHLLLIALIVDVCRLSKVINATL